MTGFRIALSVSPFADRVLSEGVRFTDGERTAGSVRELQELFTAHGATEVYSRICTARETPPQVDAQSLAGGLERARLARDLELAFNPEIGLFESYGDVLRQPALDLSEYPEIHVDGPWESLTVDQMRRALHDYGALVARAVRETGAEVNVWDIGNEVDLGVAGVAPMPIPGPEADRYRPPDRIDPEIGKFGVRDLLTLPEADRIEWLQEHIWPHEARLLAAFAEGVASEESDARFSTHISGVSGRAPRFAVAFWESMREGGYVPDEVGYSLYPSVPEASLETFMETVRRVHEIVDRPAFVAEFSYAAADMEGDHLFAHWDSADGDYEISEEGQARILEDLVAWGVDEGYLAGVRPWAPDFAWGLWAPMSFFRQTGPEGRTGEARPVIDAMRRGLSGGQAGRR